jgi:hypothetical protein
MKLSIATDDVEISALWEKYTLDPGWQNFWDREYTKPDCDPNMGPRMNQDLCSKDITFHKRRSIIYYINHQEQPRQCSLQ